MMTSLDDRDWWQTQAFSPTICPSDGDTGKPPHETTMDAFGEGCASAFKCRKCRQVVFHATHLSALECIATSASFAGDGTVIGQRYLSLADLSETFPAVS